MLGNGQMEDGQNGCSLCDDFRLMFAFRLVGKFINGMGVSDGG